MAVLQWLWRILWGPPTTVVRPSLKRHAEQLGDLEARIVALEKTTRKMWGVVTGGERRDVEDVEDQDELDELRDDRALGAARRFGKGL